MGKLDDVKENIQKGELLLVEFSSNGCAPCEAMKPIVEKLLSEDRFRGIKYEEINLSDYPEFSVEFGVFGVPTLIVFKDGKEYKRNVGYMSEKKLRKLLGGVL